MRRVRSWTRSLAPHPGDHQCLLRLIVGLCETSTSTTPEPDDPLGLFGDGPPWWTINKGKPWQRPSSSAARGDEAARRDSIQAALAREPRRLVGGQSDGDVTRGIGARRQTRGLRSATAPVPERRVPSLHPGATTLVRAGHDACSAAPGPAWISSSRCCRWCRNSGRIPAGSLDTFDIDNFLDSIREALKACGIDHYKLGLDVSLNQRAGVASPGFWQLQLWGFFHEPKRRWREQLKAAAQSERWSDRPVQVVKRDSLEAAAAYGVKSTFIRRVSYRKRTCIARIAGSAGTREAVTCAVTPGSN